LEAHSIAAFYNTTLFDPQFAEAWADPMQRTAMALAAKAGREQFLNSSEANLYATKWVAEVVQYLIKLTAGVNSTKKHPSPIATGQTDLNEIFNPFIPRRPKLTPEQKRAELKHLAGVISGEDKAAMMA
jgi:hypothetical protein